MATTCHSKIRKDHRAASDAFVVKKLRDAGAVLLGKVALHEFATGGPAFDLPWPPARNPWNRDLHPGGSSSGSGAALAAGMAPAALGTDTGGSVRNPATCCGIIGLKPTYGAVSLSGVFPLTYSLDHVGPMTRTRRGQRDPVPRHRRPRSGRSDHGEARDAGLPDGSESGAEGTAHRRHRAFLQRGRRSRSRPGARHRAGGRHAAKARRQRQNHPAVAAGAVDRLQPHHPPGRGLCHPREGHAGAAGGFRGADPQPSAAGRVRLVGEIHPGAAVARARCAGSSPTRCAISTRWSRCRACCCRAGSTIRRRSRKPTTSSAGWCSTSPARRRSRCRPASPPAACRSPCRSPAAPSTSRWSIASRRRIAPRPGLPTSARRSSWRTRRATASS